MTLGGIEANAFFTETIGDPFPTLETFPIDSSWNKTSTDRVANPRDAKHTSAELGDAEAFWHECLWF